MLYGLRKQANRAIISLGLSMLCFAALTLGLRSRQDRATLGEVRWMGEEERIPLNARALEWLSNEDLTALRINWSGQTNARSGKRYGLEDWFERSQKTRDRTTSNHTPERVWIGFSKPFLEHGTTFVECSPDKISWYRLSENVWVGCSRNSLTTFVKYDDGHDASCPTHSIPNHIRDFFFLHYEYEARDWRHIPRQQAPSWRERLEELHHDLRGFPDSLSRVRTWSILIANENGLVDRVTFQHEAERLQRSTVWKKGEPSKWQRPEGPGNAPSLEPHIEGVERFDIGVDLPE